MLAYQGERFLVRSRFGVDMKRAAWRAAAHLQMTRGGRWEAVPLLETPGWHWVIHCYAHPFGVDYLLGPQYQLVSVLTNMHGDSQPVRVLSEFGDKGWSAEALEAEIAARVRSQTHEFWLHDPTADGDAIASFLESCVDQKLGHRLERVVRHSNNEITEQHEDDITLALMHPNCPVEVVTRWAEYGHTAALADSRVGAAELLRIYRASAHRPQRWDVLMNANADSELLDEAVLDIGVKWFMSALHYAAYHPATSPHTQMRLAQHADWSVRFALAGRKDVAPEALRHLLEDPREEVMGMLAANGNGGLELQYKALRSPIGWVRVMATNGITDPDVLRELAMHPDPGVREAVTMNPWAPDDAATAAALQAPNPDHDLIVVFP